MKLQMRRMRKASKMTQSELAEVLSTSARVIGAWENGETPIPLDCACQIADFFSCTLDDLAGRISNHGHYKDEHDDTLRSCYDSLNEAGRESLLEYSTTLTYRPEYKREVCPQLAHNEA